jgi:hypothetical protein
VPWWLKNWWWWWMGRWREREVLRPPEPSLSLETRCGGCKWAGGGRNRRGGLGWWLKKMWWWWVGRWREREVLRPPDPSFSTQTRCGGCRQDGGGRKRGRVRRSGACTGGDGGGWADSGSAQVLDPPNPRFQHGWGGGDANISIRQNKLTLGTYLAVHQPPDDLAVEQRSV